MDRGISGQLTMYQNNQYRQDVRIKWTKNTKEIWWRLMNGKLKPKGERAWVLKAWDIKSNKQEILAIRFSDVNLSQQFMHKFHVIFPQQSTSPQNQSNPSSQQSYNPQHFMRQHPNYHGMNRLFRFPVVLDIRSRNVPGTVLLQWNGCNGFNLKLFSIRRPLNLYSRSISVLFPVMFSECSRNSAGTE